MSADDTTICPPKRPPQSPDGDNSPSPSSSVIALANLERHPEFWFDDGNIVLVTPKHMGFRVFRGLLAAQSTVFADMFASSCVSANGRLDGCPVVQVTDSHHDLVHLFRVLLPTSPIKYHTEPDPDYVRCFDELSAVIRLAHKYYIPSIQEQALQAYVFTSDFDTYFGPPKGHVSAHSIQPIGAVNIARLTDTPLMLPTALYACCQMGGGLLDGWTREDGTVEHLATDDAKRCFDAYVTLAREQALVPSCLFAAVPPNRCTERGRCSPSITALASNAGLVEAMMQEDVLTDRSALIRAVRPRIVCEGCTQVLLERDRSRRERLWDRLPQIFGIAIEGWVKPSGSGVLLARERVHPFVASPVNDVLRSLVPALPWWSNLPTPGRVTNVKAPHSRTESESLQSMIARIRSGRAPPPVQLAKRIAMTHSACATRENTRETCARAACEITVHYVSFVMSYAPIYSSTGALSSIHWHFGGRSVESVPARPGEL